MAKRWYVLETKWAAEDEAAQQVRNQGFEVVYPLLLVKRVIRGRVVEVLKPLFKTYIFVAFDVEDPGWKSLHYTRGVARLFGGTSPLPLSHSEVERLIARCSLGPVDESEASRLLLGAVARVTDGPLEGRTGVVARLSASGRVAVLLSIMGRETLVQVPSEWLEAAA